MPDSDPNAITGTMMLCDGAQSVGGKLYILGGGWSILWRVPGMEAQQPFNIALAIKLAIPWSQANERLEVLARLVTEDGDAVADAEGSPIQAQGEVEVGRPPGIRHGTPLDVSLAVAMNNLNLDVGGYRWELLVGGKLIEQQPFQVAEVSPAMGSFPGPR